MKLITKTLEKRFEEIGNQANSKDPLVIAKFFNPCGNQTWYATEYDKETQICYGYVTGMDYDESGYFSIKELESLELPFGLSIERDIYFSEIAFKSLLQKKERQSQLAKKKKDKELDREH